MKQAIGLLALGALIFFGSPLLAAESVCDLFSHLDNTAGRQVVVTGELFISKGIAVLGADDCDHRYTSRVEGIPNQWPTALSLRPSSTLTPAQHQQFQRAVSEADSLRSQGKTVHASASFSGLIRVAPVGRLPAELIFDSFNDLKVEALADPASLPVFPICDLFQDLSAWKGKRIAVRGEFVSSREGAWIIGRCQGGFMTDGYRWPVVLTYAIPPYYSRETAKLYEPKWPSPSKGQDLQGRFEIVKTATFIGLLHMRSEYTVTCLRNGTYFGNGFGHENAAVAELVVESIRDLELTPQPEIKAAESDEVMQRCLAPDLATRCSQADSIASAALIGCTDKVREFLGKDGIDSKNGTESKALIAGISGGNEAVVKLLLSAGAPVNPAQTALWSPLGYAATGGKVEIMKFLLDAGAKVDAADRRGRTVLLMNGYFNPNVTRVLLDAGASVNAVDENGETVLMKASGHGFKQTVQLLLEHHADVNLKDAKGRTALMHAATRFADAIPLLLENGADPDARDNDGNTALSLAESSKNLGAIAMLSIAPKTSH